MPRFLERVLCVALAVAFIGYFPAQAQEAGKCAPRAPVIQFTKMSRGFVSLREFHGITVNIVAAWIDNATEGDDAGSIKSASLATFSDGSAVILAGDVNTVCLHVDLDPGVLKAFLRAIDGQGI